MISHKHKFIFVHVPKCGGTSIERLFLEEENVRCNWRAKFPLETLGRDDRRKYMVAPGQHLGYCEFPEEFKDRYFSFTFVRNPWSKAVSEWLYFKRIRGEYNLTFKESLIKSPKWLDQNHFKLQSFFTEGCDYIGRFETLQEDFNTVCTHIGIAPRELPRQNCTWDKKEYTKYYDDETRKIVADKCSKDIEHFGYEFGE